jgi:hypothetical protein
VTFGIATDIITYVSRVPASSYAVAPADIPSSFRLSSFPFYRSVRAASRVFSADHVLKLMSSCHNLGFQALGYDNISTYTSALLICYSGGLAVATPPVCYYFFQ